MLNTLRSYCTKPVIVKSSPWLIFLIAFGVRAAYAVVGSPGLTFDEPYYDHIASQLASGNGFTFAFSAWFTSIPNEPTSVQEPLYPLVLALLKILFGSDDYMSARIFQAIIGALIPVIVVIWGEKIFSREIGILAGGILAFYPPLIYFGRLLMTEALYTLLLIGAISIISTHIQSKKRTNWLGGLIFGSACLTRSVLLVFFAVFNCLAIAIQSNKTEGFDFCLFHFVRNSVCYISVDFEKLPCTRCFRAY